MMITIMAVVVVAIIMMSIITIQTLKFILIGGSDDNSM